MAGWNVALAALYVAAGASQASDAGTERERLLERALKGTPIQVGGVKAAVVYAVHDLRELHERSRRRWDGMGGIDLVDRFLEQGGARELVGFDGLGFMKGLLQVAAPEGGPVPASAALGVAEDSAWLVLTMAASDGVLDRWVQAQPIEDLNFVRNESGISAETPLGSYHGGFDGQWLRLWFAQAESGIERTGISFGAVMTPHLAGAHMLATYDGTGPLGDWIRSRAEDEADRALASIRQITVVGGFSDDKTQWAKVLIDHPRLAVVAPFLSDGSERPGAAGLWGPDARAVLDVAVPPGWLQAALLAVPDLPEALRPAVQTLDGRFSFAAFGGLADWGLALGLTSETAAVDALTALDEGLKTLTESQPQVRSVWEAPAPGRLTFRSLPDLAGIEVLAARKRVVVLSQAARRPFPGGKDPRTPRLVELMSGSHLAAGYMLWGSESPELAAYEWFAAALDWVPDIEEELPPPLLPWWKRIVPGLPRLVTLARIQAMFLYDMAMAVDVKGSLLVVELAASEV